MEEGEVRQRRAAVVELLARGLVRLTLLGRADPQITLSRPSEESAIPSANCLAESARSSRHVSVGKVPKTLPENELRCATGREASRDAKPTKGVTGC